MCWAFRFEMGMPVGWAKNWAGARGCCSSCAFGMGEESLEPLTRALLVEGRCPCGAGFGSSKGGLLSWIQEDCRRLRAKLFLIYSLLPFSPSPCSPLLLPIPFSSPSPCQQPKNQLRCNPTPAVFTIYLQIALLPLRKTLCYHPCMHTQNKLTSSPG